MEYAVEFCGLSPGGGRGIGEGAIGEGTNLDGGIAWMGSGQFRRNA